MLKGKLTGHLPDLQHADAIDPTNSTSQWKLFMRFHADQFGPIDQYLQHQEPIANPTYVAFIGIRRGRR